MPIIESALRHLFFNIQAMISTNWQDLKDFIEILPKKGSRQFTVTISNLGINVYAVFGSTYKQQVFLLFSNLFSAIATARGEDLDLTTGKPSL